MYPIRPDADTTMLALPDWVRRIPAEIRYPTAFVTVSGAHLYGFASRDSDVDLRGVHILPLPEVVGLRPGPATLRRGGLRDGVELDLVTHDLSMFLTLLLKPNGYVLEQLLSPLVVSTTDLHAELVALAPGCVTRHHQYHYRGFANGQWKLFTSTGRLKPLLYTLRVLLTGVHLMRTGEVVTDLRQLYEGHQLPYVPDLIAAKAAGEHEEWTGDPAGRAVIERDVARLHLALDQAAERTPLPPHPSTKDALHDLLVRTRLACRSLT